MNQVPLLTVKDLSVSFGHGTQEIKAVHDFHLNLQPGEVMALVGESGSGKSVSALSILQLLPYPHAHHRSGSILFKGQELVGASSRVMQKIRGKEITIIFQEPMTSLNPLHRIEKQIVEMMLIHQSFSWAQAAKRCVELLEMVGIQAARQKAQSFPHELSGGQRQRVMIAMALANNPALLIADEPTTALDVTIQAQVLKLLKDLQQQLKMAMLFISHDLGIVQKMADRVSVMKNGQIVEQGGVQQILSSPTHPYTQELIKSYPRPRIIDEKKSQAVLLQGENIRVWFPIRRGFFRKATQYVKAVDDVSLILNKGQTLGIVGESGSGKTTLAMALLQLTPMQGRVIYQGIRLDQLPERQLRPMRKDLQVIFQDPYGSLSPRLTVNEIIAEGLDIHQPQLSADQKNHRIEEALAQVGLSKDYRSRYPHEFSGGQRQRIAIARALVLNPQLLILDEPTSALDMTTQAQIIDLFVELQIRHHLTYIFISHDLRVIQSLADQLIIMQNGKVMEQGKAKEIFANPQDPYTKKLLAAAFAFEADERPT
ncbi:MAG TPA: ABC transporter ATP-binding protein [Alphaproteobacteria bacterium]|nr:ABC transporter ATP-binding protein [Alphaproteobacteria bacterium]